MLKQLSGMDSMFLYAESHHAPLEVGCLQVYDPSTAPRGEVRFKEILATFQSRLDRTDIFRRKLVEVPLSLDHPYWAEDEDFDLEYHVRHISLPKPGGWDQLMAQVARLQARQLDHAKPLWMAHIIEGLDDVPGLKPGCFAMFLKMHHATIDGVTGSEVQAALHDLEPYQADASAYHPSTGPHRHDEPNVWNLLARSPFNHVVKSTKLGFGLVQAIPRLIGAGLSARGRDRLPVPVTPFNDGRVSPNRIFDGRFFELDDFKRIRATENGTTVNDVALTVVGGALRYYLDAQDALPTTSLIAGCPINVGTEEDADQGRGNLLSLMTPPLHTEIEDPVERLRAVHEGTQQAKAVVDRFGRNTLTTVPMNLAAPVAKNLYPLITALALRSGKVPYNTMVTNVAVRMAPLYMAGARLIRVMATGPVIDQSGIFHAVFSFDGKISIAFTACRDMLPDPAFYAECIQSAFEDLRTATLGKRANVVSARKIGSGKKKPSSKKPARRKATRKKAGGAGPAKQPAAAAESKTAASTDASSPKESADDAPSDERLAG